LIKSVTFLQILGIRRQVFIQIHPAPESRYLNIRFLAVTGNSLTVCISFPIQAMTHIEGKKRRNDPSVRNDKMLPGAPRKFHGQSKPPWKVIERDEQKIPHICPATALQAG
jgi:hypothetical protein